METKSTGKKGAMPVAEKAHDAADAEKTAAAYWAGYQSGFYAGQAEALSKSLGSIVDIYGIQLAQYDLAAWQSDWNLVGADLQNAIESLTTTPDIASALALYDYKPLSEGHAEAPQTFQRWRTAKPRESHR